MTQRKNNDGQRQSKSSCVWFLSTAPTPLRTGQLVKMEGYDWVSSQCPAMDTRSGEYTTLCRGDYQFSISLEKRGTGEIEWYLCCDNGGSPCLVSKTSKCNFNITSKELTLEKKTKVWVEIGRLDGDAQLVEFGFEVQFIKDNVQTLNYRPWDEHVTPLSVQDQDGNGYGKFSVMIKERAPRLRTGLRVKMKGYDKINLRCPSMEVKSGVFTTPCGAEYKFTLRLEKKGRGDMELYLCSNKDKTRSLIGKTMDDNCCIWGNKDCDENTNVWVEVVRLHGNAQVAEFGFEGEIVGNKFVWRF